MIIYRVNNNTSIPVNIGELNMKSDSKDQASIYFSISSFGQASQYPMYIPAMSFDLSHIEKMICTLEQITDQDRKFWRISLQLMDDATNLTVNSNDTPMFDCDPSKVNFDNFMFYGDKNIEIQTGDNHLILQSSQVTELMVDESFIEYSKRERVEKEKMIGNAVAHVSNLSYMDTSSEEKMAGVTKAMTVDLLVDGGHNAKSYAEQLIRLFAGDDAVIEKSRVTTEDYLKILQSLAAED